MERSAIRGLVRGDAGPDFAALHRGYLPRQQQARNDPLELEWTTGKLLANFNDTRAS